jgi:hypothetical protein
MLTNQSSDVKIIWTEKGRGLMLSLGLFVFVVRPLNSLISQKLDVKSRAAGAGLEPRLKNSGISLSLNLPTWSES